MIVFLRDIECYKCRGVLVCSAVVLLRMNSEYFFLLYYIKSQYFPSSDLTCEYGVNIKHSIISLEFDVNFNASASVLLGNDF